MPNHIFNFISGLTVNILKRAEGFVLEQGLLYLPNDPSISLVKKEREGVSFGRKNERGFSSINVPSSGSFVTNFQGEIKPSHQSLQRIKPCLTLEVWRALGNTPFHSLPPSLFSLPTCSHPDDRVRPKRFASISLRYCFTKQTPLISIIKGPMIQFHLNCKPLKLKKSINNIQGHKIIQFDKLL